MKAMMTIYLKILILVSITQLLFFLCIHSFYKVADSLRFPHNICLTISVTQFTAKAILSSFELSSLSYTFSLCSIFFIQPIRRFHGFFAIDSFIINLSFLFILLLFCCRNFFVSRAARTQLDSTSKTISTFLIPGYLLFIMASILPYLVSDERSNLIYNSIFFAFVSQGLVYA